MKKFYSIALIAIYVALSGTTDVIAWKTPDAAYSESEQRTLASFPENSPFADFVQWAADVDQYLLDQFPYRDEIIGQYHSMQAATGNSVVQDMYQLDSDYLFNFTYPTDESKTLQLASKLKNVEGELNVPVVYSIVPLKNTALAPSVEGLENDTNLLNRDRTMKALKNAKIPVVDVCAGFLGNYGPAELADFYYKTDFHWNARGGYNAAKIIAEGLLNQSLIQAVPKSSDFQWVDFTEDRSYMGDLQHRVSETPFPGEYIPLYELRNQEGLRYYETLKGSRLGRKSFVGKGLGEDILDYNKMCTYNLGYYRVENDNACNDLRVLILKDSYENMMTDYMTGLFSEIDVVDPRSPRFSLSEIVESRDIDLILCVYHESNISQELLDYLIVNHP